MKMFRNKGEKGGKQGKKCVDDRKAFHTSKWEEGFG